MPATGIILGRSDYRPSGSDHAGTWLEPNPRLGGRPNLYSYYRGMYQDCADPNGQCWGDNFPCMTDEGISARNLSTGRL
jgi:hypothetical protein